jgi:FHS family L-fucose permease-like MFS transporter
VLTLGQFFKSISSLLGPILCSAAVLYFGNWKWIFPIYALITVISIIWMYFAIPSQRTELNTAQAGKSLALLCDGKILMAFIGILLVVGIDVGLNTTIPKYLIERTDMALNQAGLGTSLYFTAKLIGTFFGAIILTKIAGKIVLRYSMAVALVAFILMLCFNQPVLIFIFIFIVGILCANVFSILFALAIQYKPEKKNEISALMIMAVAGGALIPPIMGFVADLFNQTVSMSVLALCIVYLLYLGYRMK